MICVQHLIPNLQEGKDDLKFAVAICRDTFYDTFLLTDNLFKETGDIEATCSVVG